MPNPDKLRRKIEPAAVASHHDQAAHEGAFGHNPRPHPSPAMIEAGNYKKGVFAWAGMLIAIENPRYTYRTGTSPDGTKWANLMQAHYGYIKSTVGADGDALDIFVGPFPESDNIYVINQVFPDTGKFDEHKVLACFLDQNQAETAYNLSYTKDWKGKGEVIPMHVEQFKWWLKNGNHLVPLKKDHLPYMGAETVMQQSITWNPQAEPSIPFQKVMYGLALDDTAGLMQDPISLADIVEDALNGGAEMLGADAMITPYNRLGRKMDVLTRTLNRKSPDIKVISTQISEPFKRAGTVNIAVVFELSDGQTVSIFFHNPDTTPKKILPTDELISWKWMLNKKDVTIVVAPEKGVDLNLNDVAVRIMKLASKNSAAFARANTKRTERLANIEALQTETASMEGELTSAQAQNEALDTTIAELRTRLDGLNAQNAALAAEIGEQPPVEPVTPPPAPEPIPEPAPEPEPAIVEPPVEPAVVEPPVVIPPEAVEPPATEPAPDLNTIIVIGQERLDRTVAALMDAGWNVVFANSKETEMVKPDPDYELFLRLSVDTKRIEPGLLKISGFDVKDDDAKESPEQLAGRIDQVAWYHSMTGGTPFNDPQTAASPPFNLFPGKTPEFVYAAIAVTEAVNALGGKIFWGDFNASEKNFGLALDDAARTAVAYGVCAQMSLGEGADAKTARANIDAEGRTAIYSGLAGSTVVGKANMTIAAEIKRTVALALGAELPTATTDLVISTDDANKVAYELLSLGWQKQDDTTIKTFANTDSRVAVMLYINQGNGLLQAMVDGRAILSMQYNNMDEPYENAGNFNDRLTEEMQVRYPGAIAVVPETPPVMQETVDEFMRALLALGWEDRGSTENHWWVSKTFKLSNLATFNIRKITARWESASNVYGIFGDKKVVSMPYDLSKDAEANAAEFDRLVTEKGLEMFPQAKQVDQTATTTMTDEEARAQAKQVAQTILEQLGGQKFIAMTGAKNFLSSTEGRGRGRLTFKLPGGKVNYVVITLNQLDLYDIEFRWVRAPSLNAKLKGSKGTNRLVNEVQNVGLESLREVFTENTGLETSLGTLGREKVTPPPVAPPPAPEPAPEPVPDAQLQTEEEMQAAMNQAKRNNDKAFIQSVIDGQADMYAVETGERIDQLYDAYDKDAEMTALLDSAMDSYEQATKNRAANLA